MGNKIHLYESIDELFPLLKDNWKTNNTLLDEIYEYLKYEYESSIFNLKSSMKKLVRDLIGWKYDAERYQKMISSSTILEECWDFQNNSSNNLNKIVFDNFSYIDFLKEIVKEYFNYNKNIINNIDDFSKEIPFEKLFEDEFISDYIDKYKQYEYDSTLWGF